VIEIFDYQKITELSDALVFLKPILISLAMTNIVIKTCYKTFPKRSSSVFFNHTGKFLITYKDEKIWITDFKPVRKFSYAELSAQKKFISLDYLNGLFPFISN